MYIYTLTLTLPLRKLFLVDLRDKLVRVRLFCLVSILVIDSCFIKDLANEVGVCPLIDFIPVPKRFHSYILH